MAQTLQALLLAALIAVITIASHWIGQQAYHWLPPQASADATLIDPLFSFVVALGSFIFLAILGVFAYAILTGRAAKDDFSDGPAIEGNMKLEIVWTVMPTLLVLWIAVYGAQVYQKMELQGPTQVVHQHIPMGTEPAYAAADNNNPEPAETIDVIAKQWAWSFRYPNSNVTSTELHLPVNRRARLALQSEDVLHGFYVPEFRIKQDIIPNRTIDLLFTPILEGKYKLHDSQFSGTYFALMEAPVVVESPEAYTQWLQQAAARKPVPAPNSALSEHSQSPARLLKSNWHTVPPTQPPVVNPSR